MFRNYLTVAYRNLVNHKLYSAINVGGLAIGLAACLLILLFVKDELSYERWVPNADRIAIVESTFFVPGRDKIEFAGTPGPIKAALDKDFSSDIERVVRVYDDEETVHVGDRQFLQRLSYVDPGFFQVFDLPMVAGERDRVLADKASIVVTQRTAQKLFGDQPALGKTVTVGKSRVFTVIGIMKDPPRNTHLGLEAIALFDRERYLDRPYVAERWTAANMRTYVLFRAPASRARVAADMRAFVDRNVTFDGLPGITEPASHYARFDFMPLLDIHLHGNKPGYQGLGDMAAVIAFAGIALLILVIGCINFVNLATARAMQRAREVALRKVVGSTRGQLVAQHLGEAIMTALIALVIAVALVEVSLPEFNAFLHKDLRLDLLGDPALLLMMPGLMAVVGALGGVYPAIYLSRFRPAQVLKANQSSSAAGTARLRTGLVVFQFAVSIALIACTATIYGQTVYARTLDVGYQRRDRLVVGGVGELTASAAATLKRQVGTLPGVTGVALSSDTPPLRDDNNALLYPGPVPGEDKLLIETLRVDPDFFAVYGVTPLAGRLFAHDRPSDFEAWRQDLKPGARQSIVINMAFARKLGASRPEEVIGRTLYDAIDEKHPLVPTTIIGVVPDLYLRSVRTSITPLFYYARPSQDTDAKGLAAFGRLTVSVAPGRMRDTLEAVREVWRRLAPATPIRTNFIDDDLAAQYDADAERGHIFAGFALLAVLIACLGLFGLASFSAERRTKEIGMRKVLGASVFDIVRLLVWQFSRPVLWANLIAWPISFYAMGRWLAGFRYAIHLGDPRLAAGIFGGAGLLALAIAWLTIAGHAYRVARANPGLALRCE